MSRMTPEGRVKARVRDRLKQCSMPVYLFMPVQNGMGEATLDFIGCIAGQFFAIETKAGYGKMTLRQQHTAHRILDARGLVFVLSEDPAAWRFFEDWLIRMEAVAALERREPVIPILPEWALHIINDTGEQDGSSSKS